MNAHHGTPARYHSGCRCSRCADAFAQRRRASAHQPRIVVCCERELLEVEGAGHDGWCPALRRAS